MVRAGSMYRSMYQPTPKQADTAETSSACSNEIDVNRLIKNHQPASCKQEVMSSSLMPGFSSQAIGNIDHCDR